MGSDIVFAVEVRPRRPAVHAAVVGRIGGPPAGQATGATRGVPAGGLSPAF
jgi:hypothetical protein